MSLSHIARTASGPGRRPGRAGLRGLAALAVAAVVAAGLGASTSPVPSGGDGVLHALAGSIRSFTEPIDALVADAVSAAVPARLLLLAAVDGPATDQQSVRSVVGCGVVWSLVARANVSSGAAEAWTAVAPLGLRACTPTATLDRPNYVGSVALYAFPAAAGVAAVGASGTAGAPAAEVAATPGAALLGVGNDWYRAAHRHVLPGQSLLGESQTTTDDTLWFQSASPAEGAATMVGTVAPSSARWNFLAVAVDPAGADDAASADADAWGGWAGHPGPFSTTTPADDPTTGAPPPTASPTAAPTVTAAPSASPAASASPTASPSPKPARTTPPAAPPPAAPPPVAPPPTSWPGAATTGVPAGTRLVASGPLTVTKAGTVIDGLDVSGSITIAARGVVVRNSRVHGNGSGDGIVVSQGSVTVEDSEIFGFENGIGYSNWTARRVNIHSVTGDGVKLGSNSLLESSWIHDLTPGPGAHADGGQMQDGVTNLVIRGNTIDVSSSAATNSALFLSPDFGPSTNGPVTVTGNYLAGGGYTLYVVDGNNGQFVVGNITVTSNVFGSSRFGSATVNVPVTWAGNVTVSGRAVNP